MDGIHITPSDYLSIEDPYVAFAQGTIWGFVSALAEAVHDTIRHEWLERPRSERTDPRSGTA
jgi:hypothetical protein